MRQRGVFSECVIGGVPFAPARFCAPMAGITHSGFRRLVAEFGGCGALFTEMLSARQILCEDLRGSPALRRRPGEKRVVYQLMLADADRLDRILGRLSEIGPDGLDINLACHAPHIRRQQSGSRLFENLRGLAGVLREARRCWAGPLTVKVRLGSEAQGHEARFVERLRLFEECGVDAVILHPRFFEERFKRRARDERYAWVASLTRLPLVANGDLDGPESVRRRAGRLAPACAVMVGRRAVAQPWLFAAWDTPVRVDVPEVWRKLFEYTCEDFPPEHAIGRIKIFTEYFARNFRFGHAFYTAVQNAPDLAAVRARAEAFFGTDPAVDPEPIMTGL